MKNPFLILSIIFWGTMILLIIRDKRLAAEAEARRQQEAEAQKAAKAAEVAQKQAEKEKREAERKAAQQAKEEERRIAAAERHAETMRRREELHQQKIRQLAELQAASTNQPKDEDPAEQAAQPEQAKPAPIPQKPAALSAEHPAPFAGQTVAFTGKIPGMTHEQAAQAVKQRGGRAFAKGMPAGTTILVCGQQKGDGDSSKLRRADELIGQIRKITAAQFIQILEAYSA